MIDQVVFSDFGVTITEREGRLIARYDAGEIAVQSREDEISEHESENKEKPERRLRGTPYMSATAPLMCLFRPYYRYLAGVRRSFTALSEWSRQQNP